MLDPIAAIRPIDINAYPDTLGIWLSQSTIESRRIRGLEELCGSIYYDYDPDDPDYIWPWPRLIGGRLYRYLQVNQPQPLDQAVDWLIRNRADLTRAHIALDWTFASKPEKFDAEDLLDRHSHLKYVRDAGHIDRNTHYAKLKRYPNGRLVASNFVYYADKPNRFTHAPHCQHIERRFTNKQALRRIGINCLADLCNFDHHSFWQDNLVCYALDLARLGLAVNNCEQDTRRLLPIACDIARGEEIAANRPVREIICDWRGRIPTIYRCRYRLDVTHLLPAPHIIKAYTYTHLHATTPNHLSPQRQSPPKITNQDVSTPLYNHVSSTKPWRHLHHLSKETTANHFLRYPIIHLPQDCFPPNSAPLTVHQVGNQLLSKDWSSEKIIHFLNHLEGSKRVA